jgi:hypothetical protein
VFQDIQQGTADLYIAILILSKFVHEKNHVRSNGSNHFGKRPLIDFHSDRLRRSPIAEVLPSEKVTWPSAFPHQRLSCGWSRRTTFNNEPWISMLPL